MTANEEKISSALDRFQEAHFYLHQMEAFYHAADPFRWSLNSFLKSIKEVRPLIQMSLQNVSGFKPWFRAQKERLENDPLLSQFSEKRDFIVHRGMLLPQSSGSIGTTENHRTMKMGLGIPISPFENSDDAMTRIGLTVRRNKHEPTSDFLGIFVEDEDNLPCVQREWKLDGFDQDILDLCAQAWLSVGEAIVDTLKWLGDNPKDLSLDCRHDSALLRIKTYSREKLTTKIDAILQCETDSNVAMPIEASPEN